MENCTTSSERSLDSIMIPVAHLARCERDHIYLLRYCGTVSRFATSAGPERVGFRPLLRAWRSIEAARACATPGYEVVGSSLRWWAMVKGVAYIFLDGRFCYAQSAASEANGYALSEEDRRGMYPVSPCFSEPKHATSTSEVVCVPVVDGAAWDEGRTFGRRAA